MPAPTGFAQSFEVKPIISVKPWAATATKPKFDDCEANKKLYGIKLATAINPFEAACEIFTDTTAALWVSGNWITDPVVIASRDLYLKTSELDAPLLDKEQLAAKVLQLAEEKIELQNGTVRYLCDAETRLKALEVYAKIAGYTGKVDIDMSTKNFTHNEMKITLVKPEEKKELKTIDEKPVIENQAVIPLPLKIKLVR